MPIKYVYYSCLARLLARGEHLGNNLMHWRSQGVNVRTCDCFGSVQLAAARCLASRELDLVEARLAAEHATSEVTRRADALRVTCYAGGCGIDLAVARILAERAAAEVTRREDMLSIHTHRLRRPENDY